MMELEELKQKWNALDEGLSRTELYNKKLLVELVKGKTQTTYERLRKSGLFSLAATFVIAAGVVPLLRIQAVFGHEATFWILEAVCIFGVLMSLCRLGILSRFNVLASPGTQLRNLVSYKRCCVFDMIVSVPLVIFAIGCTLFIEHAASPLGWVLVILGLVVGLVSGWFGWQRHKSTIREMEQSLAELKEFEVEGV